MLDINSRWDGIAFDPLNSIFQLYDSAHPLDFYVGKDSQGRRVLLLKAAKRPPALENMRAINIGIFLRRDGGWSILLTLTDDQLKPMFSLFCTDLIESSRLNGKEHGDGIRVVLRRLNSWRRLLARGLPSLLAEGEIRGLCGELLFLRSLFGTLGKANAVAAWVGPKQADQDFQAPDQAWEVKTIRPGADLITIASERQLQTNVRPVRLVVIELTGAASTQQGAFHLLMLVEQLRQDLADDPDTSDRFEELLAMSNFVHRPEYAEPMLLKGNVSTFDIGEDFPRITPDSLALGVEKVKYDLRLAACSKFRCPTTENLL